MIQPVHALTGILVWLRLSSIISVTHIDLVLILCADLIDLDHLFTKNVFDINRSSFSTHILHQNWKLISIVAILFLFIKPISFLGIGILIHFSLDHIDDKLRNLFISQ